MQVEKFKETLDLYIEITNKTTKAPIGKCDILVIYHIELEGDMSILKGYNLLFAPVKDDEVYIMSKNGFEDAITFRSDIPYMPADPPEYTEDHTYMKHFGQHFPVSNIVAYPPITTGD